MVDNGTSRSISRSRKALSIAALVSFSIKEGAQITFTRAKQSKYALKVLLGREVIFDHTKYLPSDFISSSLQLCYKISALIENSKFCHERMVIVNKSTIESIGIEEENHREMEKEMEKDCRNKEAAFSNFLAMELINKGYSLHLNITTMKKSMKVMHFYVWEKIFDIQNQLFDISIHGNSLKLLIEQVNNQLVCSPKIHIQYSSFQQINKNINTERKGVFKPANKKEYEIFCSDTHSHPFK